MVFEANPTISINDLVLIGSLGKRGHVASIGRQRQSKFNFPQCEEIISQNLSLKFDFGIIFWLLAMEPALALAEEEMTESVAQMYSAAIVPIP